MRRLTGLLLALAGGCGESSSSPPSRPSSSLEGPAQGSVSPLRELTDTGITFRHHRGSNPERKYIPETLGSGAGALDYDQDGDLDLYFVQGAPLPGAPAVPTPPRNQLFRNEGGLLFTDVTASAGVGDTGYGLGVTCPDFDNDGDPDLYVTNLSANVLYRNRGDGTFEVVSDSGLEDQGFSTAAAWADIDADGDLDVYVANYVECDLDNYKVCRQRNLVSYCHPDVFQAAPDRLFRNLGDGKFEDVTEQLGIHDRTGKGLAVMPTDHNADGRVDWFVSNDANENFLWVDQGDGHYLDEADLLGLSVSGRGVSQSCMGTDIADVDGDLDFDVFAANLGREANVLYLRVDDFFYEDQVFRTGLGESSFFFTGFGSEFFDLDLDADLDLLVVNGHVIDVIQELDASQTFAQRSLFYRSNGEGFFEECAAAVCDALLVERIGRGLVTADLDDDGDQDIVVTCNDDVPLLLESRPPENHHWLGVKLVGQRSPRDAIGARVWLTCGDKVQVEEVHGASSYLCWQDLRIVFGLGERSAPGELVIHWPSGEQQTLTGLALDRYHRIEEPRGR